ncbi:MAG: FAD-binding oxidoreductase [Pseudomonadota bacterium]
MAVFDSTPRQAAYDIVVIGGAMMGSSTAWWLTQDPDFDGSVLVIERDASYEACSTAHTNSCIRQQFSNPLNMRISQFGADFITSMRDWMGGDDRVPSLSIRSFGYLYLADDATAVERLRASAALQHRHDVPTELLEPGEIKARYPFYNVDDILLGSINTSNEGLWDGMAVFDAWRRKAREGGVEYIENEVVGIQRQGDKITSITLKSGEVIGVGQLVNASGPRGARTASMAGLHIPVEPRKRFSWIFTAQDPLDRDLPLTIDPSGVHVRENGGGTYLAGGHAHHDPAVAFDDFEMDHSIWQDHIWPVLATRIPAFEAVKVTAEWAGHYAYNTLDHNAIMGPHPEVKNFIFLNGFSGHGLQQSPAMGRATAEWLVHESYRSIDMRPFHYDRILANAPFDEKAVI